MKTLELQLVEAERVIKQCAFILDCLDSGKPLISNQGQGLDGYSALAEFMGNAKKAQDYLNKYSLQDKPKTKPEWKSEAILKREA